MDFSDIWLCWWKAFLTLYSVCLCDSLLMINDSKTEFESSLLWVSAVWSGVLAQLSVVNDSLCWFGHFWLHIQSALWFKDILNQINVSPFPSPPYLFLKMGTWFPWLPIDDGLKTLGVLQCLFFISKWFWFWKPRLFIPCKNKLSYVIREFVITMRSCKICWTPIVSKTALASNRGLVCILSWKLFQELLLIVYFVVFFKHDKKLYKNKETENSNLCNNLLNDFCVISVISSAIVSVTRKI